MNGTWVPIDKAVILSIPILAYSAKTPFPLGDMALCRTEFTLDFSSLEGSKKGRKLCLNETFLNYLALAGFWKPKEISERKHAETRPVKLQKLPFGQPLDSTA